MKFLLIYIEDEYQMLHCRIRSNCYIQAKPATNLFGLPLLFVSILSSISVLLSDIIIGDIFMYSFFNCTIVVSHTNKIKLSLQVGKLHIKNKYLTPCIYSLETFFFKNCSTETNYEITTSLYLSCLDKL